MKTSLLRTLLAFFISISGVFLSYTFLYPRSTENSSKGKLIAMARVLNILNDVKKQGTDKLIWEPVRKGDLLYLGEKLKTAALSNTKIEFIDNGASIDIEPESLIVINRNNKKLTLQVVEGSLFVSSNKDLGNLSVSSGDTSKNTINIKDGDFSYSVNKDGKANVEVLKGSLDDQNRLVSQSTQNFKDLRPSYGDEVFVDGKSDAGITFRYSPLAPNYDVEIEMGLTRNNLLSVKDAIVELETGVIKTKTRIGPYFWRLTARNKNTPTDVFSSSTFKNEFKQRMAPSQLYPIADDSIQLKDTQIPLEFKWSLLHAFDSISIEVKNSSDIVVLSAEVKNQTFYSTNKITIPGKYTWRLIGKLLNSDESLVSPDQGFQLSFGEDLQSPIPLLPEDRGTIFLADRKESSIKNYRLVWKSVKEANEYLVTIKNRDGVKKEIRTPINEFMIPSLSTGSYQWSVQAINNKKEFSKNPIVRTFTVLPMGEIHFNKMEKNVYFLSSLLNFQFTWTGLEGIENYQLKVSPSQSMSPNELIKTKDQFFNYQIGNIGTLFAQVQAVSKDNIIVAESEIYALSVTRPPLPPSPQFLIDKKILEANLNGDIGFNLVNYDKRFSSHFEIFDQKGILIEQKKINSPEGNFKSMNPGQYTISAKYIDEFNQVSDSSERRSFLVPGKSAISAPKLKGIKIR